MRIIALEPTARILSAVSSRFGSAPSLIWQAPDPISERLYGQETTAQTVGGLAHLLKRYLRQDAIQEIDEVVHPDREPRAGTLAKRITTKKLRKVSQARLARTLGITQPRVSVLFKKNAIRCYIREAGKRGADAPIVSYHHVAVARGSFGALDGRISFGTIDLVLGPGRGVERTVPEQNIPAGASAVSVR